MAVFARLFIARPLTPGTARHNSFWAKRRFVSPRIPLRLSGCAQVADFGVFFLGLPSYVLDLLWIQLQRKDS